MNELLYPDHWFTFRACLRNSAYLIDKKLFKYRIHSTNTVGGKKSKGKRAEEEGFRSVHLFEEMAKFATGEQLEKIKNVIEYIKTVEKAISKGFIKRVAMVTLLFLNGGYFKYSRHPFLRPVADIFKYKC
jgi:predicted house-cleaning noncanonical NTP pyrophosphatase (MazG superfamily)